MNEAQTLQSILRNPETEWQRFDISPLYAQITNVDEQTRKQIPSVSLAICCLHTDTKKIAQYAVEFRSAEDVPMLTYLVEFNTPQEVRGAMKGGFRYVLSYFLKMYPHVKLKK